MLELHQSLISLQELDEKIEEARARVDEFAPQLEELEAPIAAYDKDIEATRSRLDELRSEERRLERTSDENRARLQKYEERLMRVRDAREEAAARTELDLVSKALDADEQDAVNALDQIRRTELRLDELEGKRAELAEELEPRRNEILEQQSAVQQELDSLLEERSGHTEGLDQQARTMYERVRGGRTRTVLAPITADGACGHCFSMVPIQRQTEIRRGTSLVRCEQCGVILYAEE